MYVLLSIFAAFGLAILLVEKGDEWPVRSIRIYLQYWMHKIYWKWPQALFCTTCASFWTALVTDICFLFISKFHYFLWPITGFITCGLTWFIIEFLNALERHNDN